MTDHQRMTSEAFRAKYGEGAVGTVKDTSKGEAKPQIRLPKRRAPNQGEAEYQRILQAEFRGCPVLYEAITINLPSGTKYTGDWIVFKQDGSILITEVKGGFRLKSAGASARAFKEAISFLPQVHFRHATKKDGQWIVSEANKPESP